MKQTFVPVRSVGVFAPSAVSVEEQERDFFGKPVLISFQAEIFWHVKSVSLKPPQSQ